MREVDRAMVEDFHIQLIQMMENTGRSLAVEVFAPRRVVVLAGVGGNGGGGLVAARHLANRGREVHVVLTEPADHYAGVPEHQLKILSHLGVSVTNSGTPPADNADLIVDALIGYSLVGDPTGRAAELIDWANRQPALAGSSRTSCCTSDSPLPSSSPSWRASPGCCGGRDYSGASSSAPRPARSQRSGWRRYGSPDTGCSRRCQVICRR
ncbi:MAG: hypothetical protein HOV83_17670 [Catenulispora sp.]|nr:hypothetical protein [Catenulispora sp.]